LSKEEEKTISDYIKKNKARKAKGLSRSYKNTKQLASGNAH